MAPFLGPNLARTIELLRGGQTPITLGRGEPSHEILQLDGRWRLCPLVLDETRATRAAQEARAAGRPWMPEMESRLKSAGEPILAEGELELFIAALRDWWPESLG